MTFALGFFLVIAIWTIVHNINKEDERQIKEDQEKQKRYKAQLPKL